MSTVSNGLAERKASRSYKFQRFGCILLHALLVVAHLVPMPVAALGTAIASAPLGRPSAILSLVSNTVPQALVLILTTFLVLWTQKLAMWREIHHRQYLTTIHDKSTAWMGLGSAIRVTIWQCYMGSKAHSIILILLYLFGSAFLQITTPLVVNVRTTTVFVNTPALTELGRPTLNATNSQRFPVSAFSILNLLPSESNIRMVGLTRNTIFDALYMEFSTDGSVEVNATSFQVVCRTLPNATAGPFSNDTNQSGWTVELDPSDPSGYEVVIPVLGFPSIMVFTPSSNSTQNPSTVVIASTANVYDSAGAPAPQTAVSPALANAQPGLVLLACDISPVNHTLDLQDTNNLPYTGTPSSFPHTFESWAPPPPQTDPLATMLNASTVPVSPLSGSGTSCNTLNGTSTQVCTNPSVLDAYILSSIQSAWTVTGSSPAPSSPNNVSLSVLESAVANALASVTWFTGRLENADGQPNPFRHGLGEAHTSTAVIKSILLIDIVMLGVGLLISLYLLVAAAIMTRPPRTFRFPAPAGAGPLQLAWLFGRAPAVARGVAGATDAPSVRALRGAGMVKVELAAADAFGYGGVEGGGEHGHGHGHEHGEAVGLKQMPMPVPVPLSEAVAAEQRQMEATGLMKELHYS